MVLFFFFLCRGRLVGRCGERNTRFIFSSSDFDEMGNAHRQNRVRELELYDVKWQMKTAKLTFVCQKLKNKKQVVMMMLWIAALLSVSLGGGGAQVEAFAPQSCRRSAFVRQQESSLLRSTLFDEALLADMEGCLNALEKRVKNGPGALTVAEVGEFEAAASRVLADMKDASGELPERLGPGARKAAAEEAAARAAEQADLAGDSKEEIEAKARAAYEKVQEGKERIDTSTTLPPAPAPVAAPAAVTTTAAPPVSVPVDIPVLKTKEVIDTSNDDGPAWDGKGGLGLSRGTKNTYLIDGMDEMTPEEYQEALAQRIIKEQKVRRMTGSAGNRGTWDYLNYLNGHSHSNIIANEENEEEQS